MRWRAMRLSFRVEGRPIAQPRHSISKKGKKGKKGHAYYPDPRGNYKAWREAVQWAALSAMRGREPTEEQLELVLFALSPDRKYGDLSNIRKLIEDALQGIVYVKDRQIVDDEGHVRVFKGAPGIYVEVRPARVYTLDDLRTFSTLEDN